MLEFEQQVVQADAFAVLYQLCLYLEERTPVHGTEPPNSQQYQKNQHLHKTIPKPKLRSLEKGHQTHSILEFSSPNCPWLKIIYKHHHISGILLFATRDNWTFTLLDKGCKKRCSYQ